MRNKSRHRKLRLLLAIPVRNRKSIATLWNRQKFEEELGKSISEKDYHAFIEPFEALKRLQTIRAKLKPEEIVEPPKVAVLKLKVFDFPKDLPFSKEETAAYKAVHHLLSEINKSHLGLTDTDTFAQQKRLEQRRTDLLRFLWIFGCFGKFEEKMAHTSQLMPKPIWLIEVAKRGSQFGLL